MKLNEKYFLEIIEGKLVVKFDNKIIEFDNYQALEDGLGYTCDKFLSVEIDEDYIEVNIVKDYEFPEIRYCIESEDGNFIEKQIPKIDEKYYEAFKNTCEKLA